MQDLTQHAPIFSQQAKQGAVTGFLHALYTAHGLMRVYIQDYEFRGQYDKTEDEQPAHGGDQAKPCHHPAAQRGEKAEQNAKIIIQVQMCTRWRSSASSTIRQVQAVCETRQRLFINAPRTK